MNRPTGELDKNYIFDLIMPSGTNPEHESTPARPVPQTPPKTPTAQPAAAKPRPEQPDTIDRLRQKLFIEPEAPASDTGRELRIINLNEPLVLERLEAAFEKFRCCKCDKCKKDVAVRALNLLEPNYVLADPNRLDAALALKASAASLVSSAVVKAIIYVKANPEH